jgi:hypothetical protein
MLHIVLRIINWKQRQMRVNYQHYFLLLCCDVFVYVRHTIITTWKFVMQLEILIWSREKNRRYAARCNARVFFKCYTARNASEGIPCCAEENIPGGVYKDVYPSVGGFRLPQQWSINARFQVLTAGQCTNSPDFFRTVLILSFLYGIKRALIPDGEKFGNSITWVIFNTSDYNFM